MIHYIHLFLETLLEIRSILFSHGVKNLGALSSQSLRCHVPLLAAKLATEELRPAPGHELSTAND